MKKQNDHYIPLRVVLLSLLLVICSILLKRGINIYGSDRERTKQLKLSDIPPYSGTSYTDINGDVPFFSELMTTPFDGYGPLDDLGRATLAYACVGPETMPNSPRENISSIHPSGWNDAQYEGIEGKNLFNRCHLIGFQLTGQNANERNLITGTRYMNVEGMLSFENSVASYVRETGHHVMYRVTPLYDGDNLVASGVLMEAKSVEDPFVQYCVFCYNVQPGVTIDYATGENSGDGKIGEDHSDEDQPSERTVPETKDEGTDYVLNTNTKKFHYPSCPSVGDMKEKNRQDYHGTRDEIIAMGYKPCGRCNP